MNVKKRKVDCKTATYGNARLDEFVNNCAPKNWKMFFEDQDVQESIVPLADHLESQADNIEEGTVHIEPPMKDIFKALEMVDPLKARVVILGQDPTPTEDEATGLAFSVKDPQTVPSTLNILMEVALEGWSVDLDNGDLSKWAKQGVLLLNSALTVEITWEWVQKTKKEKPKVTKLIKKPLKYYWSRSVVKHTSYWSDFMDLLVRHLTNPPNKNAPHPKLVWILWGNDARTLANPLISKTPNQYVIPGGHPSPRQAGLGRFFGGNYFLCANEFLLKEGFKEINWGLVVGKKKRLDSNVVGLKPCPKF